MSYRLCVTVLGAAALTACGGGSGSGDSAPPPINFSISGIADARIDENSSYTSATPSTTGSMPSGDLSWSVSGDDAALFNVDRATGVLTLAAQDYEHPADGDADSVYALALRATDGAGNGASMNLQITIADIFENVPPPAPQACVPDPGAIAPNAIHVAPNGTDDISSDGSAASPYRSLSYALQTVSAGGIVDQPGLTIYLRNGEYAESISGLTLRGNSANPITIAAYPCETPRLAGTVDIESTKLTEWEVFYQDIYRIELDRPVWQLFVDDALMIPARWPNADANAVYLSFVWAEGENATNGNGIIRNAASGGDADASYHSLATATNYRGDPLDVSGSLIIANTASFSTYSRMVKAYDDMPNFLSYPNTTAPDASVNTSVGHVPGTNVFTHEPVPGGYRSNKNSYYLEAKLDLLDSPGEWYYEEDQGRHYVYLWAPGGGLPQGRIVARDHGYAVDAVNGSYIRLQGLEFFAAALRCDPCHDITIEDSVFRYSASSRRMLKVWGGEDAGYGRNQLIWLSSQDVEPDQSGIVFRNNIVRDTDVQTLITRGGNTVIDNNLFYRLDYTAADTIAPDAPIMMTRLSGQPGYFTNNTLDVIGNSTMFSPDGGSFRAQYNNLVTGGFAQNDGASFQIRKAQQFSVDISYNWTHDSTKYGIRFDAPFDTTNETSGGRFGMVHDNVVWNANGIMIKGDDHRVFHNTAWNNSNVDARVLVEANVNYRNARSIAANNAADSISTERNARSDTTDLFTGFDGNGDPIPRLNLSGVDVENVDLDTSELLESQLNDPHNFDFRPVRGGLLHDSGDTIASPNPGDSFFDQYTGEAPIPTYTERQAIGAALDLGAYELDAPHYWIPGRKEPIASFPIPRNEASDVDALPVPGTRSLIWRDAYNASEHHLYITRSLDSMYQIGPGDFSSIAYKGTFEAGAENVHEPTEPFETGTWYWRVDALVGTQVIRGRIWQFTVQ